MEGWMRIALGKNYRITEYCWHEPAPYNLLLVHSFIPRTEVSDRLQWFLHIPVRLRIKILKRHSVQYHLTLGQQDFSTWALKALKLDPSQFKKNSYCSNCSEFQLIVGLCAPINWWNHLSHDPLTIMELHLSGKINYH